MRQGPASRSSNTDASGERISSARSTPSAPSSSAGSSSTVRRASATSSTRSRRVRSTTPTTRPLGRRSAAGVKVYTATEYPPSETIPLHNECAYQRVWPMRLFFLCVTAAARGGETPIADTVRVAARIAPEVRERFRRLGVLYVRNYHKDLDVPWQTVFQTEDRDEVNRFCAENGLPVEW